MKITDLQPRIVAIYAGRFHPFHHGHAEVFNSLAKKFGINNTYITTGATIDPIKSPFSFAEKRLMMQAAGVPSDHVIEEVVPYAPVNLPTKLGLDETKRTISRWWCIARKNWQNFRYKVRTIRWH